MLTALETDIETQSFFSKSNYVKITGNEFEWSDVCTKVKVGKVNDCLGHAIKGVQYNNI